MKIRDRDDEETGNLHSAVFNFDERSLEYGVRVFSAIAMNMCGTDK